MTSLKTKNKAKAMTTNSSPVKVSDNHSEKLQNAKDSEKKKAEEGTKNTVPFYKLFSFSDSTDIVLMILGAIAALANGLSIPIMTLFLGQMIDSFGEAKQRNNIVDEVSKVSLRYVYLGVGAAVAASFQVSCWMVTGERQAARIRTLYLKTILRQDITFFDKETNTGEVVGRMSGDTVLIQDAMGEKVGKSIQLVSSFIGGFVIAFSRGWLLALVLIATVPLLVLSGAVTSMVLNKMATQGQTSYTEAGALVEQTVSLIRTVASFTGENQAINRYNKCLKVAYKSSVQEGLVAGIGIGSVMLIVFCSYGLAVWFGSIMIVERGYTGGDVINVIVAVVTSSISLGEASPCMKAFASGQAAAFKMFETIKRKPDIDAYDTRGRKLNDIRGDIELKDIYFSYPSRPEEQIFAGFSLSVSSGTTVALVGESGSGKSTVINLIERFYDPQAGEVLVDGINLKELQLRWIREKIGLVSQEPVLFASSIRVNIAYGKDDATLEEIRAAAELANVATFIDKMPQGLETMVGECGTQLSGGQKQRVAIARAILRDPRILLLDEATSALDAESEWIVQEALERIMTNRTTIVVAHRLSTIRNSDVIAVIHQGKIVEKGSHSELLNSHGAYSQLISLQEGSQESEKQSPIVQNMPEGTQLDSKRKSSQSLLTEGPSRGQSCSDPLGVNTDKTTSKEVDTATPSHQQREVPLRRLAYLNKPELPILLLGCLSAVINGFILPVFGVLLSSVMQTFYEPPAKLRKDSTFWLLMFVYLGLISLMATMGRSYFFAMAGSKLIKRIRSMSFEKAVHMEIGWFDDAQNSSSTIGTRLSMDAAAIRNLVGDALALIVQNSASVIAGMVIALEANWQLALIMVAMLPLLGVNTWVCMQFTKGFSANAKMMYEEASQVANDSVRNIRAVASFCAEEKVVALYRTKCEGPRKAGIRQGLVSGIGFGISFFFLFCGYAASFYAGARLVDEGKTTFTKVFRVFFSLVMTAMAVSQSSTLAPDASKAKASATSVFAILDRKSEIDSSDKSGTTLENLKGDIEFQHVSFKYPMRPDVKIFWDLCLIAQSGKTVALVGESGCGKSTVISLLQRFYNPDSGQIMLDGVEIQKFQLSWLRQQMGLVSQEPILFNETIRANIAYGMEGEATETEILAAAESANAHKFISGLQKGYDTFVGERGVQLSGGQKQRVALARAIVKAPKILLLDEATSALDTESERVVQDALDRVMVDRTTIVVAHRLTTIKGADLIAVIKDGVITEQGTHRDLIGIKDGLYASLVARHVSATF